MFGRERGHSLQQIFAFGLPKAAELQDQLKQQGIRQWVVLQQKYFEIALSSWDTQVRGLGEQAADEHNVHKILMFFKY